MTWACWAGSLGLSGSPGAAGISRGRHHEESTTEGQERDRDLNDDQSIGAGLVLQTQGDLLILLVALDLAHLGATVGAPDDLAPLDIRALGVGTGLGVGWDVDLAVNDGGVALRGRDSVTARRDVQDTDAVPAVGVDPPGGHLEGGRGVVLDLVALRSR